MFLHEVPHDPGAGHHIVIEGELVSVLARAEHEAGPLAVMAGEERRVREMTLGWLSELT